MNLFNSNTIKANVAAVFKLKKDSILISDILKDCGSDFMQFFQIANEKNGTIMINPKICWGSRHMLYLSIMSDEENSEVAVLYSPKSRNSMFFFLMMPGSLLLMAAIISIFMGDGADYNYKTFALEILSSLVLFTVAIFMSNIFVRYWATRDKLLVEVYQRIKLRMRGEILSEKQWIGQLIERQHSSSAS